MPLETSAIITHTPGPWSVKYDSDLIDEHKIVEWPYRIVAAGGKEIVDLTECETNEADAHLIAAAPDLAEALVMLMHCGPQPRMGEWKRAIQNAAAAIDKAAGRK